MDVNGGMRKRMTLPAESWMAASLSAVMRAEGCSVCVVSLRRVMAAW